MQTYSAMLRRQGQARQVYSEVSCWFLRMMALLGCLTSTLFRLGLIFQVSLEGGVTQLKLLQSDFQLKIELCSRMNGHTVLNLIWCNQKIPKHKRHSHHHVFGAVANYQRKKKIITWSETHAYPDGYNFRCLNLEDPHISTLYLTLVYTSVILLCSFL